MGVGGGSAVTDPVICGAECVGTARGVCVCVCEGGGVCVCVCVRGEGWRGVCEFIVPFIIVFCRCLSALSNPMSEEVEWFLEEGNRQFKVSYRR